MNEWPKTLRVKDGSVLAEVQVDFLQRADLVPLLFNVDTTTLKAAKEFGPFVDEILTRLPSLEAPVADAAFKCYLFHVNACKRDYAEASLPVVADAERLLAFYKLTFIYLSSELTSGHFGLGFEWNLEIEHGIGIRFRNWEIEEVGDESVLFPLD